MPHRDVVKRIQPDNRLNVSPADLSAIEISAATSLRPHPKWTRQNAKAPSHEGQIAERRDVVAHIQKAARSRTRAEVARIGNMHIFRRAEFRTSAVYAKD